MHLLAAYHVVQAIGSRPPLFQTSAPCACWQQTRPSLLALITGPVTMDSNLVTGHGCWALLPALTICSPVECSQTVQWDLCYMPYLRNNCLQAAAFLHLCAQCCACGRQGPYHWPILIKGFFAAARQCNGTCLSSCLSNHRSNWRQAAALPKLYAQ